MNSNFLKKVIISFFVLTNYSLILAQSDSTSTNYLLKKGKDDFLNNQSDNPFDLDDPEGY